MFASWIICKNTKYRTQAKEQTNGEELYMFPSPFSIVLSTEGRVYWDNVTMILINQKGILEDVGPEVIISSALKSYIPRFLAKS